MHINKLYGKRLPFKGPCQFLLFTYVLLTKIATFSKNREAHLVFTFSWWLFDMHIVLIGFFPSSWVCALNFHLIFLVKIAVCLHLKCGISLWLILRSWTVHVWTYGDIITKIKISRLWCTELCYDHWMAESETIICDNLALKLLRIWWILAHGLHFR